MNFPDNMPNPPLGLGYIASILRENGHQVSLIDCAIVKTPYSKLLSQIKEMTPDAIGITAYSAYYKDMIQLSRTLKQLNIPIILGGFHVSALPELSLRQCKADFAVIGEGELTTLELMNNWEDSEKRKQVRGIAYLEKGQFKMNGKREFIENLDDLPFPAWDLIDPRKYPRYPHGRLMKRDCVASILTTRGCPYSCSYCASTNFWGKRVRRRSPKNVVDEIEYIIDNFGIRDIHFWDDNVTLIKKHIVGICREILRRRLDISLAVPNGVWYGTLDEELLTLMKRAGFYHLCFAIESGDKSVLKKAGRKDFLDKIPQLLKLTYDHGFYIGAVCIFGLPGETYETARRTIEFMKGLPIHGMAAFMAKPIPGSRLFDEWIQEHDLSIADENIFRFYVDKNELELSDGKRKLKLPRDAMREINLRPIQIYRSLKCLTKLFRLKHLPNFISRLLRAYL